MEAAQARQKSYTDRRRRPLEFEVGDFVYLKVSPMKGVNQFGVKRKLAPRYVVPTKSLKRVAKWLIGYSYLLRCKLFSLYSMCLNLRNAFACPKREWKQEVLSYNQIYLMKKSMYKFLMSRKELLEGE